MHRLHSMVWMFASVAAVVCAGLTVTLADASEQQPAATGDVRWSAEEKAVLGSLSLKRLGDDMVPRSTSR